MSKVQTSLRLEEETFLEAKSILKLIKWQDINYNEILVYTEKIKQRKDKAIFE